MKHKAKLLVFPTGSEHFHSGFPVPPLFHIAWDGVNVASAAVGYFIDEALLDPDERPRTLERFAKANLPNSGFVDLMSGNGTVGEMERGLIIFDHDYFPEKKALLSADQFPRIVQWIEALEAMGFPDAKADYPEFEFEFISQGPQAEKEFLLATGHR